jgi:hypothetical protein
MMVGSRKLDLENIIGKPFLKAIQVPGARTWQSHTLCSLYRVSMVSLDFVGDAYLIKNLFESLTIKLFGRERFVEAEQCIQDLLISLRIRTRYDRDFHFCFAGWCAS